MVEEKYYELLDKLANMSGHFGHFIVYIGLACGCILLWALILKSMF